MLPLPNGILDVGVHYYFLVLLCLVVIIYRIRTALLLVNLHKMESIIVGLSQSAIGKKHPGIIPEELLNSGWIPAYLKKNDPVCSLPYTKLDRQIAFCFPWDLKFLWDLFVHTVQHNCGMISNSICNFPGSALSAFYLETENEIKVIEKHILYCIKKNFIF